jgi:hypothetical protein
MYLFSGMETHYQFEVKLKHNLIQNLEREYLKVVRAFLRLLMNMGRY